MLYFSFAISDQMFQSDFTLTRKKLSPEAAKKLIHSSAPVKSLLNSSHKATIDVMEKKYGIFMYADEVPPKAILYPKDQLLVMAVHGLPRLTDSHQYSEEQIDKAFFTFALYTVEGYYVEPCFMEDLV